MPVIDIALKDLTQIIRDWKAAVFLVVMPVVFTLMFGLAFSGAGGEDDPRLPVGVLDQDGSALSASLVLMLDHSEVIRPAEEDSDLDELADKVTDEELAAAVVVPAGYGAGLLAGEPLRLQVMLGSASVTGLTVEAEIQAAAGRLAGAAQAAVLSAQAYEARTAFGNDAQRDAFTAQALEQALQGWQSPPLDVRVTQAGIAVQEETNAYGSNSFSHSSAAMMVQFAMAGLIAAAEVLVLERKSRALQRLLTTAVSRVQIILGHYLAMLALVLIQLVLLAVFGQLVLDVAYFREPAATMLVIVPTALWAAALGLLIGVLSKNEDQVVIFSLIPMFLLSALGGAWMPLEYTPEGFQAVGRLTPTAWAIDGLENIIIRGMGLESAWLPAGILLGYAAICFALAVWRFKFE